MTSATAKTITTTAITIAATVSNQAERGVDDCGDAVANGDSEGVADGEGEAIREGEGREMEIEVAY